MKELKDAIIKTGQSLRYSGYLIFHPFKGFWDLKHEGRGSRRSAWILLFSLIAVLTIRRQMTGFILNTNVPSELNIAVQICTILFPFLLWCVSNWCITTLVNGEGNLRDIFITTAYALVPIIIINLILVPLSNIIVADEASFYIVLDIISIVWAGLLVLVGIMTVHQFTMGKTVVTVIIALAGMVIMLFLLILFVSVIQQIVSFFELLYFEVTLR